jgi:hypothetical protein
LNKNGLGNTLVDFFPQTHQGPIFCTFFFHEKSLSAENSEEFLGKTIFRNFFRGKLQFFPAFFGGKFSAQFSLEKMYEKSAPGHPVVAGCLFKRCQFR